MANYKLDDLRKKMMFDIVYEGMSDKEIAGKYNISLDELQSIKSSKDWKSEERRMWDKIIAALFYRRSVSNMSA